METLKQSGAVSPAPACHCQARQVMPSRVLCLSWWSLEGRPCGYGRLSRKEGLRSEASFFENIQQELAKGPCLLLGVGDSKTPGRHLLWQAASLPCTLCPESLHSKGGSPPRMRAGFQRLPQFWFSVSFPVTSGSLGDSIRQ